MLLRPKPGENIDKNETHQSLNKKGFRVKICVLSVLRLRYIEPRYTLQFQYTSISILV